MSNSEPTVADLLGGGDSREIVSRMIWRAFPGRSEREVSRRAAPVLDLSERHVRRLMRKEHDAAASTLVQLMVLVGFEVTLRLILGGRGRR